MTERQLSEGAGALLLGAGVMGFHFAYGMSALFDDYGLSPLQDSLLLATGCVGLYAFVRVVCRLSGFTLAAVGSAYVLSRAPPAYWAKAKALSNHVIFEWLRNNGDARLKEDAYWCLRLFCLLAVLSAVLMALLLLFKLVVYMMTALLAAVLRMLSLAYDRGGRKEGKGKGGAAFTSVTRQRQGQVDCDEKQD
ncbi:unnamed protein product [Phaeothamnion confervicola]